MERLASTSPGRALLALGCGVLAVGSTACESTEQESAKIARDAAKHSTAPAKLALGAQNSHVHASQVTLLQGAESAAVAVRLTSAGGHAYEDIPVAVEVASASGQQLYTNETAGLEASLQRMQSLHGSGWWVDNQVIGVKGSARARVRVGSAGAHALTGSVPDVTASGLRVSDENGEHVLEGVLANGSNVAQRKLPVYAVALRGKTVLAAGSAVVESVAAGASKVPFQIFLVGDPTGAQVQVTVAPASKQGGATK